MGRQLGQPLICYLNLKLPFGKDVKDELVLGEEKIQDRRVGAAVAPKVPSAIRKSAPSPK